ncbi:MAG: DUF1996 domain-containing protein [Actinobacteria bacterium]|nr:DUF1996 domain-containing protein [Actinomycetota bacterium]NDB05784.1 DUF1996 domain-containing protein [Acidimicrobiia bacterium]
MIRRITFLLAVGVLSGVACAPDAPSGTSGAHDHSSMPVDPASVMGEPDRPIAGPQGAVGQFVVECPYSHALPDDPIVYPRDAGASHMHVFFGNVGANAMSTLTTLLADDTTCEQALDTASYWAPALYDGNEMLIPEKSVAYYRAGLDVEPTAVEAFPAGLAMIAGDAAATEPQPTSVVAWSCGSGAIRETTPPDCPDDRGLRLDVTFPDCWDGAHLDVPGHREHMRYSSGGECPSTHPVHVPQLIFSVAYSFSGNPTGLKLASGGVLTGHADFVNSWNQAKLQDEVKYCLHRDVVCGVTSGRISG